VAIFLVLLALLVRLAVAVTLLLVLLGSIFEPNKDG
jgi:hypothetical protein